MPRNTDRIRIGLEACAAAPPEMLRGRFGLLMNQASLDRRFRCACDVLAEACPGGLRALFSPQHGLFGEQQANMIESPHERHPLLGVPVYSLYSETRRPTAEMLSGLDCFVVDLQDVGTRVYTFIWTVSHCLEACAEAGVPVLILDRPNPITGTIVEGPPLAPALCSFVGRASIPMRHGLTIGELTRLLNEEMRTGAEVQVVPVEGWRRETWFDETGRTWIPPSPNLPTLESAAVYPGQVLLEGTNLSEGRGTTTPFELVGAPFVDPYRLMSALNEIDLPGATFRPVRFRPTFEKWAGESCGGVALHVTDRSAFRAYRTTLAVLACIRALWPDGFRWAEPPYEYETEKMPIDILAGSPRVRETIDAARAPGRVEIDALAELDEAEWLERTRRFRLYE